MWRVWESLALKGKMLQTLLIMVYMHYSIGGRKAVGLFVNDDGVFSSYDLGLVSEVFSKDTLSSLSKGNMAVGHG